jgi:triacylglycerol lipase
MRKLTVVLGVFFLSACSFKVKNIKPDSPYNFVFLHQMARYAQAAYQDEAAIRAISKPSFSKVRVQTITATNNRYFLATSTLTKTHLIAIAGTSNFENVLIDADFTQQYEPELKINLHRGFGRAARLIYDDVVPHVKSDYRLLITGHSLGGAEAVILGALFLEKGNTVGDVITFGQPKVTDEAGLAKFKGLPLTRVINQSDLIPEVPLSPFKHPKPELVLFSGETYSVIEARPLDPAQILRTWRAIQNKQAPPELPDHYIANYLTNLESKITTSQLIPYPSREAVR